MNTASRTSIWLANAGIKVPHPRGTYPKLQNTTNKHYDAVVIGGGIFGCTSAYLLKESGKKVALIEARSIGAGSTGFSTAKLSSQQGLAYSIIDKQHNIETAKNYYKFNMFGINQVEQLSRSLGLECEFDRRSHTTFTTDENSSDKIRREFEICKSMGVENVELLESEELNKEIPESVGAKLGIRFGNQAQFNSYKYCTELCKKIEGDGSNVFEESRVDGIKEDKPHRIDLSQLNSSITSDLVIVATQLPITDRSLHFAFLEPVRSLCIAVKIDKDDGRHIRNMFITEDSKRSLRTITGDDSILIVAGEGYTHGDETKTDRFYESLESWARQHFNVREVLCRWSAMDYFSCDHIPFIGYLHRGTDTIFTATGFSKWGLACGVAGSYLIRDLIEGRGNEFASMLDARRWDLMHQYKGLALENWHVSKHLIGDKIKHLLKPGDVGALENGRGGIVRIGGKVIGAYRDEQGQYHFVKPVCTHVGCDLVFNEGDRVWDCPCHGSQFDVDGSVIHGPACKDLEVYKDLQW